MEGPVQGVAKDAFDCVTTHYHCHLIPFFLFLPSFLTKRRRDKIQTHISVINQSFMPFSELTYFFLFFTFVHILLSLPSHWSIIATSSLTSPHCSTAPSPFLPPALATLCQSRVPKQRNKNRKLQFHHRLQRRGAAGTFFCCVRSVGCTNVLTLTPEWSSVSGVCTRMLISAGDRLRADADAYAAS